MGITVALSVFDEFDNLYWTIQMIRLYGGVSVEFVVCDNNPFSDQGLATAKFVESVPGAKYVTLDYHFGTSQPRNAAIWAASNKWVLCMDSHIALYPGVMKKLIAWCDKNTSDNLFHGPMGHTRTPQQFNTHLRDEWGSGMWGKWTYDPKYMAKECEIPSMAMGLFLTQRDSWIGFPTKCKGFGGVEKVTAERYKKRGRKVILLPWLKWQHKFARIKAPYPLRNEDKFRNYLISFMEDDLDPSRCYKHFRSLLSENKIQAIVKSLEPSQYPLVSCLCNTYNRVNFLAEAVESFNRQTYKNKELIIMNDTPNQLIRLVKPQDDIKIYNISRRFDTYDEKLNFVHKIAAGDLYMLWDDDDISLPKRIETEVNVLLSSNKQFTYSSGHIYFGKNTVSWVSKQGQLPQQGVYTRKFINDLGGFPNDGKMNHDRWIYNKAKELDVMIRHEVSEESPTYVYRFGHGSHLSVGVNKYEKVGKMEISPKGIVTINPSWSRDWTKVLTQQEEFVTIKTSDLLKRVRRVSYKKKAGCCGGQVRRDALKDGRKDTE